MCYKEAGSLPAPTVLPLASPAPLVLLLQRMPSFCLGRPLASPPTLTSSRPSPLRLARMTCTPLLAYNVAHQPSNVRFQAVKLPPPPAAAARSPPPPARSPRCPPNFSALPGQGPLCCAQWSVPYATAPPCTVPTPSLLTPLPPTRRCAASPAGRCAAQPAGHLAEGLGFERPAGACSVAACCTSDRLCDASSAAGSVRTAAVGRSGAGAD